MRLFVAALLLSTAVVTPALAAPPTSVKGTAIAASKKDAPSYTLELKAAGPYKKGVEGTVELVLTPKAKFHVNPDYPAKFKLVDPAPAGVAFPKKVLTKADGKFEEAKGTLKIPFVAANAGKATISGVFHFSVCSDTNCYMEKAEIDVDVTVK
jgi:hypothetical protein